MSPNLTCKHHQDRLYAQYHHHIWQKIDTKIYRKKERKIERERERERKRDEKREIKRKKEGERNMRDREGGREIAR